MQEFAHGRTHHAYLITGPKGIGKATLAYRMARYALSAGMAKPAEAPSMSLFGEEPAAPKVSAQGLAMEAENPVFKRVASGSHSDLRVLEPGEETKKPIISVDAARKIPEFLSMTPAEGEYRVVIIDAAEQMNPNAANALLKTIEEPPARAMIFLISHEPGRLLPTIRSRCRLYALQAPHAEDFAQVLRTIAPSIDESEYASLYALSYGSPGYAITLQGEGGADWYMKWLKAMQPTASHATRQAFADSAAAQKSIESWDAVLHGWNTVMHRLTLWPHKLPAIHANEAGLLSTLADAVPPRLRAQWMEQGTRLIAETDTFNLDKRYSIRLLADPHQLERQVA